jgi:hypothetical protein
MLVLESTSNSYGALLLSASLGVFDHLNLLVRDYCWLVLCMEQDYRSIEVENHLAVQLLCCSDAPN